MSTRKTKGVEYRYGIICGIIEAGNCVYCGRHIDDGHLFLCKECRKEEEEMNEFRKGEYIIYTNGDRFQIGRIKRLREDGAFVCYHEGETAAKTPYEHMHKLINGYCIKESTLGGDVFK